MFANSVSTIGCISITFLNNAILHPKISDVAFLFNEFNIFLNSYSVMINSSASSGFTLSKSGITTSVSPSCILTNCSYIFDDSIFVSELSFITDSICSTAPDILFLFIEFSIFLIFFCSVLFLPSLVLFSADCFHSDCISAWYIDWMFMFTFLIYLLWCLV